jgi:hypothetical protein
MIVAIRRGQETRSRFKSTHRPIAFKARNRIAHMPPVYDENIDDGDDLEQPKPSQRADIVVQEAAKALEDAMAATLKTSRYLPWLMLVAAISAAVAATALGFGVAAYFNHAPQTIP